MSTFGHIDDSLLKSINNIVSQNADLRQQVIAQQKIRNDIKLHDISKDVAMHIDNWMKVPYADNMNEQQDIKDFAFRLTKYVYSRLK